MMSRGIQLLLLSIWIFPYVILLFHLGWGGYGDTREVVHSLFQTLGQAILSTALVLIFGFLSALGVWRWWNTSWRQGVEILCLLPGLLPTLFVILGLLNFWSLLGSFPVGWTGVIVTHLVMNLGLATSALVRLLNNKAGRIVELAWIEGATRTMTLRALLRELKKDLFYLGFFFFSLHYVTFAVPLLVGGGKIVPIELLLYEKIHVQGDWSSALSLGMGQALVLLGLSWWLARHPVVPATFPARGDLLYFRGAELLPLAAALLVILGLIFKIPQGFSEMQSLVQFWPVILEALAGTLIVALGTSLLVLALLFLTSLVPPESRWHRFYLGYSAPSTALMGMALLLVGPTSGALAYVKMILGIAFLSWPALYRLAGYSALSALSGQIQSAWIMGAGPLEIFRGIILPQVAKPFTGLAALAALWASGDYALSSLIAPRDLTLGLVLQDLTGTYRLGMATLLAWLLLLCGGICAAVMGGIGFVLGQKSHT